MKSQPGINYKSNDIVMTPSRFAKEIIDYFNPSGLILEPCRGDGGFYNNFLKPKEWCEITEGKDFFDFNEKVDWIITNPPYSQMLGRKKDKPNPLFAFRNDLYLFIINSDYTEIEILIIPGQKNLWNTYYFKIIQGEFDEVIHNLRANAITFFDYGL